MAQFPPPAEQPKKNTTVVVIVVLVVVVGFCFFIAIGAAILFPVFAQAKLAARKASTMATAKSLSLSLLMYSSDNDDRFPPQLSTSEDLLQVAEQYSPPGRLDVSSKNPDGGGFLPNAQAAGVNLREVLTPGTSVLVYDSKPWKPDDGRVVGLMSGGAKYVRHFDPSTGLQVSLGASGRDSSTEK
ncbi:MAG TPA: hypothetical protein VNI20_12690 [Fimbriimonadaceae bacterium]|nr:hypothetical protein [Fimbriimonadaceae bacterium]